MADKIKVVVCSGTACFVMGGSELLLIGEQLPDDLKGLVEVEGAHCLGKCRDGHKGGAPYATVNGKFVDAATLPDLIERIREAARESEARGAGEAGDEP